MYTNIQGAYMYVFVMFLIAVLIPVAITMFYKFSCQQNYYSYWVLFIPSIIFFLSIFVPSPLIHGKNTNFGTHFIAGISAGLIGFIIVSIYPCMKKIEKIILALAVAALLGVGVEIAELTLKELGILHLSLTDTSWDLLADMSGSIIGILLGLLLPQKQLIVEKVE